MYENHKINDCLGIINNYFINLWCHIECLPAECPILSQSTVHVHNNGMNTYIMYMYGNLELHESYSAHGPLTETGKTTTQW